MSRIIFTQAEIDLIETWKQQAIDNGMESTGAFEAFYENLSNMIGGKLFIDFPPLFPDYANFLRKPEADEEDIKTFEWLQGAAQVNAGVGLFGTMGQGGSDRHNTLKTLQN